MEKQTSFSKNKSIIFVITKAIKTFGIKINIKCFFCILKSKRIFPFVLLSKWVDILYMEIEKIAINIPRAIAFNPMNFIVRIAILKLMNTSFH